MRRIIYFSKDDKAYHDMLNKIDAFFKENTESEDQNSNFLMISSEISDADLESVSMLKCAWE